MNGGARRGGDRFFVLHSGEVKSQAKMLLY